MPIKTHLYDQVSAELAAWLDNTAGHLTDGMMDGGRAPFAAPINHRQQLGYYHAQFFNPDGSDNIAGRDQVFQGFLPQGRPPDQSDQQMALKLYTNAMAAVLHARSQGAIGAPLATAPMVDPNAPQGG
jgi:hypothetical protein